MIDVLAALAALAVVVDLAVPEPVIWGEAVAVAAAGPEAGMGLMALDRFEEPLAPGPEAGAPGAVTALPQVWPMGPRHILLTEDLVAAVEVAAQGLFLMVMKICSDQ